MKYIIYKYISTDINGTLIDLVSGVKDENNVISTLTLLQMKNMIKDGNEFMVGDLQLASFKNISIHNDSIVNLGQLTPKAIRSILECIEYIQTSGWPTPLNTNNPKAKRMIEKKINVIKEVDVLKLKENMDVDLI